MKKTLFSLWVLMTLAACTERYVPYADPYVAAPGTYIFNAEVEGLSGLWTWDAARNKVGVYASNLDNALFQPRAQFDGATGTAELIGEGAVGQAYAYLPYRQGGLDAARGGRQPLPGEQSYTTDARSQIEENTVLVAAADETGTFRFRYLCGAIHFRIKINLGEPVQRVTLSSNNEPLCGYLDVSGTAEVPMLRPGYSIAVTGIGRPCTERAPLDVWVMLPAGEYTGLYITVAGETESISTIVEGTYSVVAGQECEASAEEKKNHYDGSDFEGEEVSYD